MRSIVTLVASIVAATGCASPRAIAPGWHPSVWSVAPDDPSAQDAAIPFPDGKNGTELVVGFLSQARLAGVTGLSNIAIQVGRCTREIAIAPPVIPVVPAADLDRITFDVRETVYACRRAVDLTLVPGQEDARGIVHFSDTEMVEREDCTHAPRQHVVTRYRVDLEHSFVPPDWAAIQRWSRLDVHASEPRCDSAAPPRNELRARLHFGAATSPMIPTEPRAIARAAPATIIALARSAEIAAKQDQPAEATRVATQALAAWGDGAVVDDLDETAAGELVEWVAAARYYAVEADTAAYLASVLPDDANAAWAAAQSAELDRITARYQQVRDVIRLPQTDRWLRAGAAKLARLHDHFADLLESIAQHRAAAQQREQARALETASRAAVAGHR